MRFGRTTALAGYARSSILLPPDVSRNLLEAKFRATSCLVGDVHRSTPCASARITPSLPFRHDPCCGRARRSAAWLVNRRSPHPRRFAARPIPCYAPPPPLSHKLRSVASSANVVAEVGSLCASGSGSSSARPWITMPTLVPRFPRPSNAPAELSRLMRRGSPAQSLLAMLTVVARAMKTPARHTGCGKEEQPVRRSPMRNAALRRARFVVPCRRPRRPRHRPRQRSCHVLCSMPRRSRAFHAAPAPRQALAQAGCRVTPMQDRGSTVSRFARLLRVFDRLPTGSFGSSCHGPQGWAVRRHAVSVTRRSGSRNLRNPHARNSVIPSASR